VKLVKQLHFTANHTSVGIYTDTVLDSYRGKNRLEVSDSSPAAKIVSDNTRCPLMFLPLQNPHIIT